MYMNEKGKEEKPTRNSQILKINVQREKISIKKDEQKRSH